jgi:hypothetical protein
MKGQNLEYAVESEVQQQHVITSSFKVSTFMQALKGCLPTLRNLFDNLSRRDINGYNEGKKVKKVSISNFFIKKKGNGN